MTFPPQAAPFFRSAQWSRGPACAKKVPARSRTQAPLQPLPSVVRASATMQLWPFLAVAWAAVDETGADMPQASDRLDSQSFRHLKLVQCFLERCPQLIQRVPVTRSYCVGGNVKHRRDLRQRHLTPYTHDYNFSLLRRKLP